MFILYTQYEKEVEKVAQMVLIKTLLYTGIRVGELIKIKLEDVNLRQCQIKINDSKGHKDRVVPFPKGFREVLLAYIKSCKEKQAIYLFESIRKKTYTALTLKTVSEPVL